MMDLRNPRTWTDATLDQAIPTARKWAADPNIAASLAGLAQAIVKEDQRRAEIRIERGEFGTGHDAAWYESRPEAFEIEQPLEYNYNAKEYHAEASDLGLRPGQWPAAVEYEGVRFERDDQRSSVYQHEDGMVVYTNRLSTIVIFND